MGGMRISTQSFKALLWIDGARSAEMSFVRLPKVGDEIVFRHKRTAAHARVTGLRRDMEAGGASFIITAQAV
jgi:hypothetical protein